MKRKFDRKIEEGRVVSGHLGSRQGDPYGAFIVMGPCGRELKIIVGDGRDIGELGGWEHVSVSISGKHPPNWQEMAWIKDRFWDDEETVLQFHPKRSQHINIHPNCLHLWRQVDVDHALPPPLLV